jgi:uncharacterized membrane protein YedE/YeeE
VLEMLSFSLTAVSAYALGALTHGGLVKIERLRPWFTVVAIGGLLVGLGMALSRAGQEF